MTRMAIGTTTSSRCFARSSFSYRPLQPMMPHAVDAPEGVGITLAAMSGQVEFRGVSFFCPSATQTPVKHTGFTTQAAAKLGVLVRLRRG